MTEIDDSQGNTGSVTGFTLVIQPHLDLTNGFQTVTVQPGAWYYAYVDVPVGCTNITVFATNLPPTSTPPLQLYLNYNAEPDFSDYLAFVLLNQGSPPAIPSPTARRCSRDVTISACSIPMSPRTMFCWA